MASTLRLYRADSYLHAFAARVVERLTYNHQPALILDQTAFYPAAGGQPNDLGFINGAAVTDVVERKDGEIVHVLAGDMTGDTVHGEIDWPRRFDHMQQHSGQHVLSQAFVRAANLDTISVHIGAEECTLDLPSPRVPTDVIECAEREANDIVAEDRPFIVREVTDAELAGIPVRRPPKVAGLIRIVEVKDYDRSACGGTHVRSTAHIGLIKITKAEKRGDETRIYFRCGRRAYTDYARLNVVVANLVDAFKVGRYEVDQAVSRLSDEAKATRKALAEAQTRLIEYEAAELLAQTRPDGAGVIVIARAYPERDPAQLRALAKQLTAQPGVVALLGASGENAQLCFARSADVPHDMAHLLRQALSNLSPNGSAKGGGTADFAQGGGVPADLARVEAVLHPASAAAAIHHP
jgi:alanyl-tRNA synthetase